MHVDSTMETEPESNQLTTTERLSSGESSSTPAAAPLSPYGLTPLAMKALGEDESQVLVCFRSRSLLFCGSKALALEGNLPVPRPAQLDDIFADFDPNYHSVIVQQRHRSFTAGGRTALVKATVNAAFVQALGINCNLSAAPSKMQGVKRARNLQLRDKEGSSGKQPDGKPSGAIIVPKPVRLPSLIVIKTVAGLIELHTKNPNSIPKPANKKKKGFTTGAIFVDWKLSTSALPELALAPSLRSHLPWFYIANPRTRESSHIFGNMEIQQNFSVANTDLESIYRLLYSKDGWLLFQGRKVDSYSDEWYTTLPVFLFNPTTGGRIDLPSICYRGGRAAFCTTTEGTPNVVIFVISRLTTVRVYTVRPGGPCWVEHSYELTHPHVFMHKMVLCGSFLYCFYKSHSLIFNLENLSWHPVTPASPYPDFLSYAALELKGKVVMVSNPEYFTSDRLVHEPIRFFRIEMSENNCEWVELTGCDEELDGRIWFIDRVQSFSVKVAGSGQKMCWFGRKSLKKPGFMYGTTARALLCLNLTTRSCHRLIADSVSCRQCAWIDLGCLSDHGLMECGITCDDLLPGF